MVEAEMLRMVLREGPKSRKFRRWNLKQMTGKLQMSHPPTFH